jgi:ribosome-interacting GTPase 1
MARTQKNKATAGHLGLLKAKLAKLRRELITPKGGSGGNFLPEIPSFVQDF